MHTITLSLTVPGFLVDLFTLILLYPFVGLALGITQNLWVSVLSDNEADFFFNAKRLRMFKGYILLWPYCLYVQFLVKIIRINADRAEGFMIRDYGLERKDPLTRIVKSLRVGSEVSFIHNGPGRGTALSGKVLRKYNYLNCSYLASEGQYLRLPNGKASSYLVEVSPVCKVSQEVGLNP